MFNRIQEYLWKYNHVLLTKKENKTAYEVELLAAWDKARGKVNGRD